MHFYRDWALVGTVKYNQIIMRPPRWFDLATLSPQANILSIKLNVPPYCKESLYKMFAKYPKKISTVLGV